MPSGEAIKRYKAAKIGFSLFYFLLFLVIFPWVLKFLNADFIPGTKFILAVLLGFFLANVRAVLKLKDFWKEDKSTKGLWWVYLGNYLITVIAICIIGSYILIEVWLIKETVSFVILFCLGFAADSIFYLITRPGDIFQRDLLSKIINRAAS